MSDSPKDVWWFTYLITILLGYTALFPWNIFIKNDWFYVVFKKEYPSYLNTISQYYMVFLLTSLIAMLLFSKKMRLSYETRLIIGYSGLVATFCWLTLLPFVSMKISTYLMFVQMSAGSLGFFGGMVVNALFAIMARFPAKYVQSVVIGQALAGVTSGLLVIFEKLILGTPSTMQASRLFGGTSILLATGILGFSYMRRSAFFRYYAYELEEKTENIEVESGLKIREERFDSDSSAYLRILQPPTIFYPVSIFFVLFVTLSCFTEVIGNVVSSSLDISSTFSEIFIPLAFLCFDIGDYMGRSLPGLSFFNIKNRYFHFLSSLIRIVFIPVFMLCNFGNDKGRFASAPRLITSDPIYLCLCWLFGTTNGYAASLIMMHAPETVPFSMRDKLGMIMPLALGIGLALGPFFAVVMDKMLN